MITMNPLYSVDCLVALYTSWLWLGLTRRLGSKHHVDFMQPCTDVWGWHIHMIARPMKIYWVDYVDGGLFLWCFIRSIANTSGPAQRSRQLDFLVCRVHSCKLAQQRPGAHPAISAILIQQSGLRAFIHALLTLSGDRDECGTDLNLDASTPWQSREGEVSDVDFNDQSSSRAMNTVDSLCNLLCLTYNEYTMCSACQTSDDGPTTLPLQSLRPVVVPISNNQLSQSWTTFLAIK